MGIRPLYRDHDKGFDFENFRSAQGHAGLWYDKFCDQWNDQWNVEKGHKLQWINTLLKEALPQNTAILQEVRQRRQQHITYLGGELLTFKTDSPFVTGLGREHPVENGFAWHHAWGVPYLSGSSLKGTIRAWAQEWQDSIPDADCIKRIFGSQDKDLDGNQSDSSIGNVLFFDALPVNKVMLRSDVMTPHYSEYYQEMKKDPGDWMSPIPIPFLTVELDIVFQFGLAPRSQNHVQACKDFKLVREQWLPSALEWMGTGAKTAVGYGRFVEC